MERNPRLKESSFLFLSSFLPSFFPSFFYSCLRRPSRKGKRRRENKKKKKKKRRGSMFAFPSENVTMWLSDFFRENLMIHVAGRRKEFNAVISVGLFIMDGWTFGWIWIFLFSLFQRFNLMNFWHFHSEISKDLEGDSWTFAKRKKEMKINRTNHSRFER